MKPKGGLWGRVGYGLWVVLGVLQVGGLGWGKDKSTFRAQEDEGYGSSYEQFVRKEHLTSNSLIKAFRPRTAREAIRLAGRIAEKEAKQEPKQSFSLLFDNTMGGRPIRVAVQDVVEVTTSRWNIRGFRKFNKNKLPEKNEWPDSRGLDDLTSIERPAIKKNFDHGRTARKSRSEKNSYGSPRKPKRSRSKREVGDTDSGFNLPPMSNEWQIKKKKKKKKKKRTTEAPVTKQMQTKSKKYRLYMESGELDLSKANVGRRTNIVKDLSKELDDLLKMEEGLEPFTSSPKKPTEPTRTGGAKFVEVPKNWQHPPSWKPPTLRPRVQGVRVGKRRHGIVTIGPPVYSEEVLPTGATSVPSADIEATTLFDWRKYENPLNPSTHRIELKPAPDDWPEPTHPSDGIYDWHKAQIRMGHTNPRPHFATSEPKIQHSTWAWSRFAKKESNLYHRNDMWQTRPWIPQVKSLSTWPPIGTRAAFSKDALEKKEQKGAEFLDETPQILGRKGNQRKTGLMEEVHLTAGPPLATVDQPYALESHKTENGAVAAKNHQESHQYSYHYGPHHSSWQSNLQGQQTSNQGIEQYQSYQHCHANHTSNSYSQYYQNYETRLGNKSAEVHYEQGHHYEDPGQALGHYQAHYQYQERPKSESLQPRIMPPAYFYNVHKELISTAEPRQPRVKVPFRAPDEYAGNDRDLRAPMSQKVVVEYPEGQGSLYPTRGWLGYRFNRLGPRRPFPSRFRRPMFRSMFKAPLQKDTWTTSLPERPKSTGSMP